MPRPTRPVPAHLVERPFSGSVARRAGWLTARQLRGPRWRRLLPDVYVAVDVEVTHVVLARAARVLLPAAVVSGRSAAWLWRVDVDGPDGAQQARQVEVTVPPGGHRRVDGLQIRRRSLPTGSVGCPPWLRDVPVLWPEHVAVELAADPARGHVESVVVLDQFVEAGVTTLPRLWAAAAGHGGRGVRQLRAAVAAADGLAGSPPETRLRLALHATDLPRPQAQYRLATAEGRRVKVLDFAWPHLRFAVEYDGAGHVATSTRPESAFRLPKDRRVLNEAHELGWRIHYVTAPDGRQMAALVARISAALHTRAAELRVPLHVPSAPPAPLRGR